MSREEEMSNWMREHMPKDKEVSMTDATEILWGSSGRGSPRATRIIENLAILGHLTIRKAGRARYVSLKKKD